VVKEEDWGRKKKYDWLAREWELKICWGIKMTGAMEPNELK
jgi:hypothetical protein